jgi:hypothetical protein
MQHVVPIKLCVAAHVKYHQFSLLLFIFSVLVLASCTLQSPNFNYLNPMKRIAHLESQTR